MQIMHQSLTANFNSVCYV